VIVLGLGSTVAVALHAALQLFGTARVGLLAWPSIRGRHDPDARAITRRLVRSIGVAAWPTAAMYVLLALAGTVPGGTFVVQLSYSVFFALSYVSARAVPNSCSAACSATATVLPSPSTITSSTGRRPNSRPVP
jgi:putative peptidoglycan lipid II flippase